MDENYLDSLLNEVSLDKEIDHKIEDELDNQIRREKRQFQEQQLISDEELFNMDLELDAIDLHSEQDVQFSEEQMDELDQLDHLADLDIGDLDFSDIDFNDLDVTKLDDIETDDLDDLLKDFEGDLDIGNLFDSENTPIEEEVSAKQQDTAPLEDDFDTSAEMIPEQKADLNEDSFDADSFLDSLLEDSELPSEELPSQPTSDNVDAKIDDMPEMSQSDDKETRQETEDSSDDTLDLLSALEEFGEFGNLDSADSVSDTSLQDGGNTESDSELSLSDSDDLDDLLSLLDLDDLSDGTSGANVAQTDGFANVQSNEDLNVLSDTLSLDDIEELPTDKSSKKKGFMELLFGEPDEDDELSEEELAEIEAKKEAKKAKKQAAKAAKEEKAKTAKEEKNAKNKIKQKEAQDKRILKAQRKAQLKAEELAEAANEKKLNKPMVLFIFTLFLGGTFLFYLASNNFNYSQAIEKATNYFANQKYRKAYDEIVGVEVKEKDEDLKDRIYTVMYVERLYESYLNNIQLGRYEKALDSLLRGVAKYEEHYEEAEELGITSDLDYSFNQIKRVLNDQFGITLEQAQQVNALEDYEYVQFIQGKVNENIGVLSSMSMDVEGSSEAGQGAEQPQSVDAAVPKEQKEEVEE
ncbi:MAG: hypothetical protein IJP29_07465 [Lachnospiraceae bacterium]|nr:hypothetical protein [Lachnospiraceae bacterium]